MTKQVQLRRGTTAEHQVFTGAEGELTIDTTRDIAIVHDGVTAGGHELVGVAATGQSIINKDAVAIGTGSVISPLTVDGNSYITGVSTLGGINVTAQTTLSNLEVSGVSTFVGLGTTSFVRIGTGNTAFIVEGDARITGVLTVGQSSITIDPVNDRITVGSISAEQLNISATETTTFSLETQTQSVVGLGSTEIDILNATGVLVGDKLSIDGIFNRVPIKTVNVFETTPYTKTLFETTTPVTGGFGSTSIVLNNTAVGSVGLGTTVLTVISSGVERQISIGDSITVSDIGQTYYDAVSITGFSTQNGSPFNTVYITTNVQQNVSTGSTIIPIPAQQTTISVGSSLSITGIFNNVPIVGLSSVLLSLDDTTIHNTSISTSVGAGSSVITVETLTNVSAGSSISITGIFDRIPVVGITTVSVTPYDKQVSTTSISTTTSAGATLIGIANSSGVSIGNSITISGVFNKVPIIGFSSVSTGSTLTNIANTSVGSTISIGSTIVSIASTNAILVGDFIGVGTYISNAEIVGINTNSVLIGSASTSQYEIPSTTSVFIIRDVETFSPALQIGSGNTSASSIAQGTSVTITGYTTTSLAALISPSNVYGGTISAGVGVTFSDLVGQFTPAILIGTGSTYSAPITNGVQVSISSVQYTNYPVVQVASAFAGVVPANSNVSISTFTSLVDRVTIGSSFAYNVEISAGSTVTFERIERPESILNGTSLNITGITTLSGLTYPTEDGLKGQVLVTDGLGNIGFGTGGGAGGSEVILRVSANTGSDDNDGKILPLRTIKKATQLASFVSQPVTIQVETGEYIEDNPIIVYDSKSIIGDSLRNIVVRPLNAGKDLFKVRNGCYLTGMSFNDYVDVRGVPQHTYNYAIAFDDPYDANISRVGYAATYASLNVVSATYSSVSGFTTITVDGEHQLAKEYSVKMTGLGWTCGYDEVGISTFEYDHVSGVSTVTFFSDALMGDSGSGNSQKGYKIGDKVFLDNLPFSCAIEHTGVTTTIFPDGTSPYGKVFTVTGINTASKTLTFNAGVSTIPHVYEGYATVAISTFAYDSASGLATATTATDHGFSENDRISLAGLEFSCAAEHAGITTTIFPDGTVTAYSPDGYTFRVANVINSTTFEYYVGVSTIAHTYETGGTVQKVPTIQEVWYYPDYHKDGQNEFGVVAVGGTNTFTIRGQVSAIQHYYTQGGTINLSRPIINKSPYIQNCSILSSLGGNGILVDGDKVAVVNKGIIPELGEIPVVGDQPEFGKSMVAATFTMVSFGGIGWRTINDGYAQVVSCFQIFCRYGSLCQSGGYLSITNSATNFGSKALRSTGFSRNSFVFDRGYIAGNGTQDGLQTLKAVGLGRSDQELYVLRFYDFNNVDRTSNFKPLTQFEEFTMSGVNTTTNVFTIPAHPFINGESVVYNGNEQASPPQVLDGLVNDSQYYIGYIDASSFRLYEDEGLATLVTVGGTFTGVGTFTKNLQEFYNYEFTDVHNEYQKLTLASAGSTANFVSGRAVTQGSASGFAVTYSQSTRQLVVSVEEIGGNRTYFSNTTTIDDHSAIPISVGIDTVVGLTTYWSANFKVESTVPGNLISGINSLTENYSLRLHRPSIVNSSAHTWEYSGSGTDYNALPQNGGKGDPTSEQVSELGGRVYASGTNELGDFKIGTQITAFNRTGNIIFNNKVTIGELASIRLSLSGGVAVEEFSTDTGLGDNEVGGPKNSRVSTQLAVKSFLTNRLGSFIDKQVSTNAIPNAVVQLNGQGQINADLIPPQVVTFNLTNVGGGRTVLVNEIPAKNILQGDTIVEPEDSFVLVNDVLSQYLILDNETIVHTFENEDIITSALTETVTGVVTAPPQGIGIGTEVQPYVGYGTTGYVKGVCLSLAISNGGSGYTNPGIYTAVTLTTVTGVGQSAYATITIGAGNTATVINAFAGGRGYVVGDVVSVADALVGGRSGGAQLQATVQDVQTRLYVKLTNSQKFAGTVALPDYISDGNAVSISTSLTDNYSVDIDPTDFGTGGDIDFTDDRIIVGSGHQFGSGDPIIYDANGGSMIAASGNGILNLQTYYTKPVGVSSVELYYDYSLVNKLNFTSSGIGTHVIRRQVVNVNKNSLVIVGHGFTVGDPFRVYGAAPTGITTHEFYYLGSVTPNAFTLHETQADALLSINGVSFNPVGMSGTSTGITTLTNQNVRYSATINTSSQSLNNYALLARDSIDASNIVSGIVASTRLGTGVANDFTFLNGSSEYKKVITSVGIGTTQPISVTATSSELAAGGIGVNTYYGNINLVLNRVSDVGIDDYTTLGVSKFKKSTFAIGSDGEIQIKAGSNGDVNANSLQGQGPAYYLNSDNHTGSVPITRGGTGLTGVPADGAILIGNSSAYSLTTTPTFKGNVTIDAGNQLRVGPTIGAESKSISIDNGIRELFRLGSSSLCTGGFFVVSGTRGSYVHTSVWSWSTTHNSTGRGVLTLLSSGEYSNATFYLDVASDGSAIISMNPGGTTTFQVSVFKMAGGNINFGSANTDHTTEAAGYNRQYSITTISKGTIANTFRASSITETSDIRVKSNVSTITDALDKVSRLRGVEFDTTDNVRKIGLIAQEVETVVPEAVLSGDTEESLKGVSYGNLVGLLIESIKELKSEIEELKSNQNNK